MITEGKTKVIREIETFILRYKKKAKEHQYHNNDDVKCFKRIYALAELFPVNDKYHRKLPEIEWQIKQLWLLYYYYKQRIDGKNLKYNQIVIKYS